MLKTETQIKRDRDTKNFSEVVYNIHKGMYKEMAEEYHKGLDVNLTLLDEFCNWLNDYEERYYIILKELGYLV